MEDIYPKKTWLKYASVEEAGFSSELIEKAHNHFKGINSAAILVIFNGAVVATWGDVTRRFRCHSIRKAFLSALYGVYVREGKIDLHHTLEKLGIDDDPPLLESEKQARVIDLLKSMSGVYHPAAFELPKQQENRPKRGSHSPGEHYWYNNWDFNVLHTIFEQQTKANFFEDFRTRVAVPLQMEDFRLLDTHLMMERELSIHPAYRLRMSARDLARFGLLFLREGRWRGIQILPASWIKESTATHHEDEILGYGYCWETFGPKFLSGQLKRMGAYAAFGSGNHFVAVLPAGNMVIVNRTNTFRNIEGIDGEDLVEMFRLILNARIHSPTEDPHLVPLEIPTRDSSPMILDSGTIEKYVGDYILSDGSSIQVAREDSSLILTFVSPSRGQATLLPLSESTFSVEDFEVPVKFTVDSNRKFTVIQLEVSPGQVLKGSLKPGSI